jgi:hypothetical protein
MYFLIMAGHICVITLRIHSPTAPIGIVVVEAVQNNNFLFTRASMNVCSSSFDFLSSVTVKLLCIYVGFHCAELYQIYLIDSALGWQPLLLSVFMN